MREKKPFGHKAAMQSAQPFLYEIRVKGRLSSDQWTAWFDDLTVTAKRGESMLRGRLADHSALYGLLGRLRDLAVPLVAVRVLDAEAQRKLYRKGRRYNLLLNALLMLVYLVMVGGLVAVTVFMAPIIHTALALSILFALVGGLAHGFWLWSEQKAWRWISYLMWPSSVLTFFIFTAVVELLHPTLAIAVLLFLGAGGLVYLLTFLREKSTQVENTLVSADTALNGAESTGFGAADTGKLEESE